MTKRKSSYNRVQFVVVLIVTLIAWAVAADAGTLATAYDTGFESPDFAAGALVPQDAWSNVSTNDSPATVAAVAANTGAQGVELVRGSGVDLQADANYFVNLSEQTFTDVVKVTWEMNVQSTGASPPPFGPFFGMDNFTSNGGTKRVGYAGLDATTGEVLYSAAGTGLLSVDDSTVTLDAWHTWVMTMDFNALTYDVAVNAVTVLDDIGFADVTVDIANFSAAALTTFPGSNDTASNDQGGNAYYDNYLVQTGAQLGDLNLDNIVNCADIDVMRDAVIAMTSDPIFNVDGVGGNIPDEDDFDFLIEDLIGTGRGDGDCNKNVNFADFTLLSNNFGMSNTLWNEGNFNIDTITNFEDFVELANNFGMVFPSAPTPEPSTALILVVVGIVVTARMRSVGP